MTQRTACAHRMAQIPELWRRCLPADNERLVDNRVATIQRTEAGKAAKKAEKERIAADKKAEKKRVAAEKKAEKERVAAEKKAERERVAAEKKAEKERIAAAKKAEKDRITAEKKAGKAKNGKRKAVPSSSIVEIPEASSVVDTAPRTPPGASSSTTGTAFTADVELVAAEEHLDNNIDIDGGEDTAADDRLDDDTGEDRPENTDVPTQFSLHPDDPKNFLKLSAALLILGKRTITSDDVDQADILIREYCTELITVFVSLSEYFHLLMRCHSCTGRH